MRIAVIPSEAEGSRGSYLKDFAAGSLDFPRDDGLGLRGPHVGVLQLINFSKVSGVSATINMTQ
jgi:hypothetical protein